jgi:hypothetical protein
LNAASPEVVDAAANDCCLAKRKEGFESSHAARLAGGKKNGGDFVAGFWSLVFGLSH